MKLVNDLNESGEEEVEDGQKRYTWSTHVPPPDTPQASSKSTHPQHHIPKDKIRLIWRDIYAEVIHPKENKGLLSGHRSKNKAILNQVSGFAEPGQLTFIMGSSGAGKSTLLNILTQKKMRGIRIFGEVAINNFIVEMGDIKKYSAYVQKNDLFVVEMTVQEHLMFAARLRIPSSMGENSRKEMIDDIIMSMGLVSCRDTRIGDCTNKGITASEKKRLSFASEILTGPSILFCDEPTSGLDSYMSLQVVVALKVLATEGKTVITTIHQPSSQVYELADRLILMAQGQVAYQGVASDVGDFFQSCSYPRPMYVSLPDHFMKILSRSEESTEQDHNKKIEDIIEAFQASDAAKYAHYITHVKVTRRSKMKYDSGTEKGYAASWRIQTWWLFVRSLLCIVRNPEILRARLIQISAISLILGIVYFKTELRENTLMNYKGSAMRASADMIFMFLFPCITVFTANLPTIIREYQSSVYSPTACYVAINAADAIQYVVFPTLYSMVVYVLAETLFLLAVYSGYAAACIFGTLPLANTIVPIIIGPLFLFAGLFIDLRTIPIYFKLFPHISFFKYAYEAHLIAMLTPIDGIEGCDTATDATSVSPICSAGNGIEVLKSLGYNPYYYWINITILAVMMLLIRAMSLVFFIVRIKKC